MHSTEKDTLAYQLKSRPGTQYRDASNIPVPQVAKAMNAYMSALTETDRKPEHDAIWFYLTNHAVAEVRAKFANDEPLGKCLELVDTYQSQLSQNATRMFYYLLLICTRESRHLRSCSAKSGMATKYGSAFKTFHSKISDSSSVATLFNDKSPDMSLGVLTQALTNLFNEGSWGGGYGGKAWGEVADCLNEFVHGRYSAEMMMDTAFTLCHNNGPIFNKGMLFGMYDPNEIIKILDVQRSGQIPQLVANNETKFVTVEHVNYVELAVDLLGEQFGGYVDWYLVEDLGSMGSYGSQKQEQVNAHGLPASQAKKKMQLEKAKMKAEMAAEKKKAEEEAEWFMVMPGTKVKKIQVRSAAA